MSIDLDAFTERLRADAEVFRSLLTGISDEQARWKPIPEKWSLLEVINHLCDEEREDFRQRLDLTLHHPGRPWPPIDPPGWAAERRYNARDLGPSLDDFLRERQTSLAWLAELPAADWEAAYLHPRLGAIRAGDLLASWIAHDLIHIRQMTRLHYEYLSETTQPFSASYAGPW